MPPPTVPRATDPGWPRRSRTGSRAGGLDRDGDEVKDFRKKLNSLKVIKNAGLPMDISCP